MRTNIILAAAQDTGGSGVFNDIGIKGILLTIFGIVLIFVAIRMAGSAPKGKLKDNADTSASVLLAVIVAALGVTGMYVGIGSDALGVVFGG